MILVVSGVITTALWHKQTLGRETQHFTRLSAAVKTDDDDDDGYGDDDGDNNHHKIITFDWDF